MMAFFFAFSVLAGGCDLLGTEGEPTGGAPGAVLVANQGNFSDANGSITVYDPASDSARHRVMGNLGSIVQSIHLTGGTGYIMANSANRIDVFDPSGLQRTAQIDSVRSPRYMARVGPSTAYVTNLFSGGGFSGGSVTVLDLDAQTASRTVEVGSNPEGIAVVGDRAFVANNGFGAGSTVSVLDTETHRVVDSVEVDCDGPRIAHADGDGEVWIFCSGNTTYDQDGNVTGRTDGAVRILDGETGNLLKRIAVDGQIRTAGPGQDAHHSPETRRIYAVRDAESILRFDTSENSGPDTLSVPQGESIGAVAYDPGEDVLYVGRVPSFSERGTVQRIDPASGTVRGTFAAGVAPSHITFRTR